MISWEPYIDRRHHCHICGTDHVPFGHTHTVEDLAARWDTDHPAPKKKPKPKRRPPSKGALAVPYVLATTTSFPTPTVTVRKSRRRRNP